MNQCIQWEETGTSLPQDWLSSCVAHLKYGGIAILPTETGYMMAVDGLNEEALDFLYETKGRPEGRATHFAVHSIEVAASVAHLGEQGARWMRTFSPGPLSVISAASDIVPRQILGPNETIGVRIPDHEGTLQVLGALKSPLTATSANYAGAPHEVELDLILQQFPEGVPKNWFILKHDSRKYGIPSTMVLDQGDKFKVLREGPISELRLADALKD